MYKGLVSVVIPIYNVERYLDCCITSVVQQTYRNLEILLIDDGSPDKCPAMCDAWAARDSRIRVIHKQNAGLGMARNTGIEHATGWTHMSMYGVNAGVPKTLVRHVTRTVSELPDFAAAREVLLRILDTPISPELLPPDEKGDIAQQTEDIVGPYALHDFFLYYAVRYGYAPARIYEMCCIAFREEYDPAIILKWLKNFYRRFFTQQFKRNCSPDGAAVGSVSLSPRGAWAMPSDAQAAAWLNACEEIVP